MATAIIPLLEPLILEALPSLINLITGLVHHQAPIVESQNGSGTGPVKFAEVFDIVKASLQKAAGAGQIGVKTIPSDEILKIIIQAIVSSLKASGQLDGEPTTPVAPVDIVNNSQNVITVSSGQSVLITVK